jgi:hypothetical protein
MRREANGFMPLCQNEHLIDGVYILNRGYIHLTQKRGVTENADGNAITQCYFSILNLSKEKLFVVDLRI